MLKFGVRQSVLASQIELISNLVAHGDESFVRSSLGAARDQQRRENIPKPLRQHLLVVIRRDPQQGQHGKPLHRRKTKNKVVRPGRQKAKGFFEVHKGVVLDQLEDRGSLNILKEIQRKLACYSNTYIE